MPKALLPSNEKERLEALRRFEIFDTQPESIFDDIVKIVSQICDTPIALISLIDVRVEAEPSQTTSFFWSVNNV